MNATDKLREEANAQMQEARDKRGPPPRGRSALNAWQKATHVVYSIQPTPEQRAAHARAKAQLREELGAMTLMPVAENEEQARRERNRRKAQRRKGAR